MEPSFSQPLEARISGNAAASDPTAAVSEPIRLYLAKTAVRSRSAVSFLNIACSRGTHIPKLPADGFMLPVKAPGRKGAVVAPPGDMRPAEGLQPAPARHR